MKTIKEEITAIATIMNMNLTTTILQLHDLGFDFNKPIEDQSQEVDSKVSQMLLQALTVQPQPIEEVVKEETIEVKVNEEEPIEQPQPVKEVNVENYQPEIQPVIEVVNEFTRKYDWMANDLGKNNLNKKLTTKKIQSIKDEMLKYCFEQNSSNIKYEFENLKLPSNKKDKEIFTNNFEKIFSQIFGAKMITENNLNDIKSIGKQFIDSYAEKIEKKIKNNKEK